MNGSLSKNSNWKGEKAKYQAFHRFALRHWGKPSICEMCGAVDRKMYHWAAKNRKKGGRTREDWLRLCVSCHSRYDGRTGKPLSEETKRKIGAKNAINSLGNKNRLGQRWSDEMKKKISERTKLGMLKKRLLE